MPDIFKDILPSILEKKVSVVENDYDAKDYNPYLVNKSLAAHIDCLYFVQQMNLYNQLDAKMQYDYLFNSIKRYKRKYQKWIKNDETKDLELIKEYYNYSSKKAKEVLLLFSKEDLNFIRETLDKGGR